MFVWKAECVKKARAIFSTLPITVTGIGHLITSAVKANSREDQMELQEPFSFGVPVQESDISPDSCIDLCFCLFRIKDPPQSKLDTSINSGRTSPLDTETVNASPNYENFPRNEQDTSNNAEDGNSTYTGLVLGDRSVYSDLKR
ncbi:uncharacterized protein LOC132386820 isoform X1 [Hypanus sabinus]|uniref:uncharacterized protein LOC132386820 isoform X1 n=1 Tax=Hypanus sabinus TaxID=79690 RepID=UPI0028C3C8FC|nr:uncharacterized protein LOC132386820 isoform X1 [Hypanus sabinus]